MPYAEAIFDRASIEIARGCTEGCRFCQAGMIYRPVRERSPDSIMDSLSGMVSKAGYDEASLTSLSTADYSAITPLVKTVMGKLRDKKVSLSVSSLRAYGLNEDLLDELASVRATGLTFAPEAGTQRMRDVVNKNVTEDHIRESAERVFAKGWSRLKLYFMIGLPTEEEDDVRGIVETGMRMLSIGRAKVGGRAQVTVSVSSHVPKPHTPFQWCRMDTLSELEDKQKLLRKCAAQLKRRVKLKTHESGISFVEGILARGDRRVSRVIEHVWKNGARFDGWDEMFDLGRWTQSLQACNVDPKWYLETIPLDARLPWDHIDVGLADGFLAREYRRALKDRLSHPCGKPYKTLLHHTNAQEAEADERKLVCYDCGVACDLTKMRTERIDFLQSLPVFEKAPQNGTGADKENAPKVMKAGDPKRPRVQFRQGLGHSYRLRYTKTGRAAYIGHLDMARLLARMFRRAGLSQVYSQGFHPKPLFVYGPALPLGAPSLGEVFDVRLEEQLSSDELCDRLNEIAPEGIHISGARRLCKGEPKLGKTVVAADWMFHLGGRTSEELAKVAAQIKHVLNQTSLVVSRGQKRVELRPFLVGFDLVEREAASAVSRALGWRAGPVLTARCAIQPAGSIRPREIGEWLGLEACEFARLAVLEKESEPRRVTDELSAMPMSPDM